MAKDAEKLAAQAERVRQLRALARVSQLQAANEIGVTPRAYQAWEAGDSDISRENLKRLARYYGTTEDYIEYGRLSNGATPDLSQNASEPDVDERLAGIEDQLGRIEKQLGQLNRIEQQLGKLGKLLDGDWLRELWRASGAIDPEEPQSPPDEDRREESA